MKEKKNIDRIFQEQLKDYELAPHPKVWERIQKDLKKDEKILPLFPLWMQLSGVAALLALLFLVGRFWLFSPADVIIEKTVNSKSTPNLKPTPQITPVFTIDSLREDPFTQSANAEEQHPQESKKAPTTPSLTPAEKKTDLVQKTNTKPRSETEDLIFNILGETELLSRSALRENHNQLTNDQDHQLPDKQEEEKGISLFDEIAKQQEKENRDSLEEDSKTRRRLALQPHISPIYYSSIGGGSALDPQFADNRTKGKVTTSYGINIDYQLSNRIQLRTGINKVDLQYNTPDIAYLPSQQNMGIRALGNDNQFNNTVIISTVSKKNRAADFSPNNSKIAATSAYTEGELHQEMSYIEIPMEMVYTVIDRRFGVHLIGGTSALVLNNDHVQIQSTVETKKLGRAENINSLSFTGNLGMGFSYELSRFMAINLEPTFKYQFNGFSGKTGDFKPYYLGLYSGIRFKF